MGITLETFRKLFVHDGNVLNQFWLFDKNDKYLRTICYDTDTKFDTATIINTYMNIDENDETPVLCIRLDV